MMSFERDYLFLLQRAIKLGDQRMDRTGVGTRALFAEQLRHKWSEGFPLITHRKLGTKAAFAEMACWLKGITDVDELAKRGCNWWEANLQSYNERKEKEARTNWHKKQWKKNRDLGYVYGGQWRAFQGENDLVDQLTFVLEEAKRNPTSRRLLVTAWNPADLDRMALPPCYYSFQLFIYGDKLDLLVNMRSVDIVLGLPNDIIGNAFLQLAICHELGKQPGRLLFNLADTHVYENHVEVAHKMLDEVQDISPRANWHYEQPPEKAEDFEVEHIKVCFDRPHVAPKYSFPMAV